MTRATRFALLSALVLMAAACGANEARMTVITWLYCDECVAHELDSVRVLGARALPELQRVLEGPHRNERARVERDAANAWRRARREAQRVGITTPAPDSATAVRRYTRDHFAGAQYRAVSALDAIHSVDAGVILRRFVLRDTIAVDGVRGSVVRHASTVLTTF